MYTGLAILLIFVYLIICSILSARRRRIVQDTSILLKKLFDINRQYTFDWSVQRAYTYRISLNSKPKYDRYELIDLLDENILHNDELSQAVTKIVSNRSIYESYSKEVEKLKSEVTPEEIKELHISYSKYVKIEQKLFSEEQLRPILDCEITCIASYTSPQRRNHYSKSTKYSILDASKRAKMIEKCTEEKNSEEMRRKRARSKMTDKMRYSILKRDGFRCQICGRTANDGVKLHVDHIMPVSKGGETEPNNLRTLCEACNLGKSDEIE